MPQHSTFETELQLINFVLNQMGDHRTIEIIDPLDEDAYTAYISLSLNS